MANEDRQNPTGEARKGSAATGSLPVVSVPEGGGAIRGIGEKFAANPALGTGSMTVPLGHSPGRAGFTPDLSLTYDSGSGNGPFGFGWRLATPQIMRKTDKGLPRYQDALESDDYIYSGLEDLVPVLRADGARDDDSSSQPGFLIHRYIPRIESAFSRIERWTDQANGEVHWRSISRENVTSLFGTTAASRIYGPNDPQHTFTWLIAESYDDTGNAIRYDYVAEMLVGRLATPRP